MVTVEHLRPDIPADIGASPGSTFGGIEAYLELMKACWAQVRPCAFASDLSRSCPAPASDSA